MAMVTVCLDETRASAFVAGDLPLVIRESIEDHVDDCGSCRQLLSTLVRRAPPMDWPAGRRVGRYVVRERIGRGGMGTVYRADDVELDRPVALKRLAMTADGGRGAQALLREARAAAKLAHPNVVTVHEVGDDAGVPFLAMELVDGTTLTGWLRGSPRPWRDVVRVLAQAGRGLAAAHERGIVHRDFKPDNVLVDQRGRARVADFGLARIAPAAVRALGPHALARSTVGLAGTPAYLAPELLDGVAPDARSDQFAFGVALYEALHGVHPFVGATAEALWAEMAAGRIRAGKRGVPAWLDRHVRRALAADPRDRWPSIDAFVDAIERGPRRRWPWLAAAAGAVLLAGGGVAYAQLGGAGETCAARGVDRAWNPLARAVALAQLTAAAPARATSIATAGALADDFADRWRAGEVAACHADPAQRVARQSCLQRDLAALGAQLATWDHAAPATVDRVVAAAAALPRPDDCASPPPIAHAPAALLDRIARVSALGLAGKDRETRPELAGILADAEATGDPETIAIAMTRVGALERNLGEVDRAHDHQVRAAREAARAGDDGTTMFALIEQAALAIDRGHAGEALALADAADAVAARGKTQRDYLIEITRADALANAGRAADAVASYRRALAVLEPLAASDRRARLDYAAVLGALGSQLGQQFKLDESVALTNKGLAIETAELGGDHPEVARTLTDLAKYELALERVPDAVALATRAHEIFVTSGNAVDMAQADMVLGSIALAAQNTPTARAAFERAAHEVAALPPDHELFAAIAYSLAQCDEHDEHMPDAALHYRKAIAIDESAHRRGTRLADEYLALAMVEFDLSQWAAAKADATKGLAEHETAGSSPAGRVNGWIVLSELAANAGQRAAAIGYAKQVVAALDDPNNPEWVALGQREQQRIAELSR